MTFRGETRVFPMERLLNPLTAHQMIIGAESGGKPVNFFKAEPATGSAYLSKIGRKIFLNVLKMF